MNNKNNNRRKGGKMKRIRGLKNIKKNINDIYLTPKRKRRLIIYEDKNQSTAAITERNTNTINNKNIEFNTTSNKDKFKEVSQRLKMEMPEQKSIF